MFFSKNARFMTCTCDAFVIRRSDSKTVNGRKFSFSPYKRSGVHMNVMASTGGNDSHDGQIHDDTTTTSTAGSDGDTYVQYYSPNNIKTQPRRTDVESSSSSLSMNSESESIPSKIDTSPESVQSSVNEYSFFDEATIYVRAGSGGQGSSTYKKSGPKNQNGIPDGGNGGSGGNVYLIVDNSLNTLTGLNQGFRPNSFGGSGAAVVAASSGGGKRSSMNYHSYRPLSFRAENGFDGERQFKNGKYGKDVFIRIPPGTVVQEEYDVYEEVVDDHSFSEIENLKDEGDEDEEISDNNQKVSRKIIETKLIDLGSVGELDPNDDDAYDENGLPSNVNKLLVAKGGEGGEGSGMQGYKKGRGVKRTRSPPVGGERRRIKLTLKIVADIAIVGVPNAGVSF